MERVIPKKSRTKVSGILHEATDWVLLNDLDKLVIPSFIAALRPNILIFSPSTRKVVLIELTCPCEENMEEWHKTKFYNYEPLAELMKSNKWSVDIFAIQVGTRGYCAVTVKSCLSRLGFHGELTSKILKRLSKESLKTSFAIWLSRDSFNWSIQCKPSSFLSVDKSPRNLFPNTSHNDSGTCPSSKGQSEIGC